MAKNKNQDSAKKVFEMLSFQYKPIEKQVLEAFKEQNRPDLIKLYKSWSYAKKIKVLDLYASQVLDL